MESLKANLRSCGLYPGISVGSPCSLHIGGYSGLFSQIYACGLSHHKSLSCPLRYIDPQNSPSAELLGSPPEKLS